MLSALFGARVADADVQPAPPSVGFTYPNEATDSVPPDAVFWVVASGQARAWIDQVPLTQIGTSSAERHQFVYPAPLTDGEHELVARAGDSVERVTFRVAARPPSTGSASIDSVGMYPQARGPDGWLDPPGYDAECSSLSGGIGKAYARVSYSGEGDVIAYLLQEALVVPSTCNTFIFDTWSVPSQFSVAAILPTGVTEQHTFAGTVEVYSTEEAYPELYADGPSACSFGIGRRAPSALASVGLALVAWLARRRRATR